MAEGFVLDRVMLAAPSAQPRQVFAVGLNYVEHARESGVGLAAEPAGFPAR